MIESTWNLLLRIFNALMIATLTLCQVQKIVGSFLVPTLDDVVLLQLRQSQRIITRVHPWWARPHFSYTSGPHLHLQGESLFWQVNAWHVDVLVIRVGVVVSHSGFADRAWPLLIIINHHWSPNTFHRCRFHCRKSCCWRHCPGSSVLILLFRGLGHGIWHRRNGSSGRRALRSFWWDLRLFFVQVLQHWICVFFVS